MTPGGNMRQFVNAAAAAAPANKWTSCSVLNREAWLHMAAGTDLPTSRPQTVQITETSKKSRESQKFNQQLHKS